MTNIPLSEIMNIGFAVFVAIFLLTRLDSTLKSLDDTIKNLSEIIKNTKKITNATQEEVEELTDLLETQNRNLKRINNLVLKIPKRAEFKEGFEKGRNQNKEGG